MSGKRKRVAVSLQIKLDVIKRFDQGETIKKVTSNLGVGEVTVGDWKTVGKLKSGVHRELR
jgi:transposase